MNIEWKMLLFATGLLFIIVGIAIADAENPAYSNMLVPLYELFLIIFYLVLVVSFLSLLIAAFEFVKKSQAKGLGPGAV